MTASSFFICIRFSLGAGVGRPASSKGKKKKQGQQQGGSSGSAAPSTSAAASSSEDPSVPQVPKTGGGGPLPGGKVWSDEEHEQCIALAKQFGWSGEKRR